MNLPELTSLARERLAHAVMPDGRGRLQIVAVHVPEGPTEHCKNALQALPCLEGNAPAVYAFTPELARAARRVHSAVVLLEHGAPKHLAAQHVRRAIESLIEANLQWEHFPEVRGAVARLLYAWNQLEGA